MTRYKTIYELMDEMRKDIEEFRREERDRARSTGSVATPSSETVKRWWCDHSSPAVPMLCGEALAYGPGMSGAKVSFTATKCTTCDRMVLRVSPGD